MPLKAKTARRKMSQTRRAKKTMKVTQTVKVPKLKPTQKAGILDIVKRVLNKQNENKGVGNVVENNVLHNSPIGAGDCYPIIAPIAQVDTSTGFSSATQRFGDRITPKSLTVSGVISLIQPQNTTQSFYVRVMVLAQKDIKVGSQVTGGVNAAALLRPMFNTLAGNDQVPFSGNTEDILKPINTDLFRVYYDRVHKVCANADGVEENPARSYVWSYRFKQLPASLTFDEGNGDYPNNFAPFVAVGYAYCDGTAPDIATTRIVSNTYSLFTFTDM